MQFCFICFSHNSFEETETDTNVSLAVICDTIVSVCVSRLRCSFISLISTGSCLGFIISRWILVIVDVLIVCGRSYLTIWSSCVLDSYMYFSQAVFITICRWWEQIKSSELYQKHLRQNRYLNEGENEISNKNIWVMFPCRIIHCKNHFWRCK